MKGKMTQPQMVLAATGGGILLVAVAAGYFGWSSLGEVQGQAQALAERKVKPELAAILTRPGGAGAARKEAGEIAKLGEELAQGENGLVGSWREGYVQASGEGQGWSQDPNQWKDRLIASYDRLKKQSGKKGDNSRVILADDFYLGLQDYKQQNPPADKVPDLARQLSVAEKLVELLMDSKKSAKEAYPTQCLMQSIVVPAVSDPDAAKCANQLRTCEVWYEIGCVPPGAPVNQACDCENRPRPTCRPKIATESTDATLASGGLIQLRQTV
jgi:hypothetical protein